MGNPRNNHWDTLEEAAAHVSDSARLQTFDATVHNYRDSGCCVACAQASLFPADVVVDLDDEDMSVSGRVVWRSDQHAGIRFFAVEEPALAS